MKPEPIAYIPESLFETGIGQVTVCRFKSNGRIEVGVFLVDVYCLGVKNAFFIQDLEKTFNNEQLPRIYPEGAPDPRPGADGRKLVEGAIAYATKYGFAPHRDYKKAARVFGGIDPKTSDASFEYGKDGKPLYISGPYDNTDRIMTILSKTAGPGAFDYITEAEGIPDDDLDEE